VRRNFKFLRFFFKIQYPAIWRCFLVLNAPFDERWTSTIPLRWFLSCEMSLGWILEAALLVADAIQSSQSLLKQYCHIVWYCHSYKLTIKPQSFCCIIIVITTDIYDEKVKHGLLNAITTYTKLKQKAFCSKITV